MAKQVVTLANIGNGMAAELFDHELKRIFENMTDPNTKAETKRSVTLKVVFTPFRDRSGAMAQVECSAKLATVPAQDAGNVFLSAEEDGELKGYTADTRQADFFEEREPAKLADSPNVVRMTAGK